MLRSLPLLLPPQLRQETRNLKPNQVAETTSLNLGSPFRKGLKKNRRVKMKRDRDQRQLNMGGVMRKGASPSLPQGRRKMKGLKRGRDMDAKDDGVEEDEDVISEEEEDVENGVDLKRPKLA